MAPPAAPRRPTYSRRSQYSLFAAYLIALGGIVAGLLMVVTARFDPAGHARIQLFAAELFAPVNRILSGVAATVADASKGVEAYLDAGSKNRALEAEVRAARTRVIEADALARENARLKAQLGLVGSTGGVIASARLIGSTGVQSRRFALFDAGSRDGIAIGQPVRTPDGLAGRVVATGRTVARVLLITDGGNVVPVRRLSDGVPALATGRGDGSLDIRSLDAGVNPFRAGDVLITSGAGGIYPPDIPVARVVGVSRDAALARPLADPARLDIAFAVAPFMAEAPPPQPEP